MTTASVPSDVEGYLEAVRAALGDLPTAERDDLVAEVEASLLESAEDEAGPIAARLGPPEDFAAELRSAAGLQDIEPAEPATPSRLSRLLEQAAVWLAQDSRARSARELITVLAPLWWVVRGYVAVALLALATETQWSTSYPLVPRFGSGAMGLLVILLAIVGSVWFGLRLRRRAKLSWPAVVVNVLLVATCQPVFSDLDWRQRWLVWQASYQPQPAHVTGLARDGVRILNVYPYNREGELLKDVLLYDNFGLPLTVLDHGDPFRRYLETSTGGRLLNSFPIRYLEPDTRIVRRPDFAPPQIPKHEIVTPPLD